MVFAGSHKRPVSITPRGPHSAPTATPAPQATFASGKTPASKARTGAWITGAQRDRAVPAVVRASSSSAGGPLAGGDAEGADGALEAAGAAEDDCALAGVEAEGVDGALEAVGTLEADGAADVDGAAAPLAELPLPSAGVVPPRTRIARVTAAAPARLWHESESRVRGVPTIVSSRRTVSVSR